MEMDGPASKMKRIATIIQKKLRATIITTKVCFIHDLKNAAPSKALKKLSNIFGVKIRKVKGL